MKGVCRNENCTHRVNLDSRDEFCCELCAREYRRATEYNMQPSHVSHTIPCQLRMEESADLYDDEIPF